MGAVVAVVFPALLVWAAWDDIRNYRIPNILVGALLALFVLAAGIGVVPRNAIPVHLGAGAIALLIGFALYCKNWIGGGDAKLFAVLVLWAGAPEAMRLAFVTALAGGAISAVILLRARITAKGTADTTPTGAVQRGHSVPYGAAIAVAGFDFWIRALAAPFLFPSNPF